MLSGAFLNLKVRLLLHVGFYIHCPGLAGLVWSSDKFVEGAAAIANHAGMSPLLIGMTIVSLGTSAPEIVVSIMASLSGSGELAVGNALGSNITNIGLVLGVTLLIRSIAIDASTTKRELPQMVIVTCLPVP